LRRLTTGRRREFTPVWSPDGSRIAFTRGDVHAVSVDGSGERRLTRFDALDATSAAEVVDARTGRVLRRLSAQGAVSAASLSATTAALLVDTFAGRRIELLDARSGRSVGSVPVPPLTDSRLAASGGTVCFSSGRTIWRVDRTSRRLARVTETNAPPIGLSAERTRVAWAENVRGQGLVRVVELRAGGP
jgi:WD40-like Beta Propeller Repeat